MRCFEHVELGFSVRNVSYTILYHILVITICLCKMGHVTLSMPPVVVCHWKVVTSCDESPLNLQYLALLISRIGRGPKICKIDDLG